MIDQSRARVRRDRQLVLFAVLIAVAPVTVVTCVVPSVFGQPKIRFDVHNLETTLLEGLIAATLFMLVTSRPLLRRLALIPAVLVAPLVIDLVYVGFDIRFGMASERDAAIVTCAGLAICFAFVLAVRGRALVTKEMREQAARRRTYILRVIYAGLAYVTGVSFTAQTLVSRGGLQEILGQGKELAEMIIRLQILGIYLFMPAMCCNLITSEKERDTLSLLFLTRMSPTSLLAGKFLSRLLPMLFFISLSLPLLGFTYSLGGFELEFIAASVWLLLVTTLQAGAFALLCSCWYRTTVGAFIACYVFGVALTVGPLIVWEQTELIESLYDYLNTTFGTETIVGVGVERLHGLFLPMEAFTGSGSFLSAVRNLAECLFVAGFMFVLARVCVVHRATVKPRNRLLLLFRAIDRLFHFMNDRLCGGIFILTGNRQLAHDRPIAWRETTHRTMGTARYLIRVFMLIEYPILFLCSICVGINSGNQVISMILPLVWIISVLLICGASASVISAERSGQTLDVLLSTPMKNRSILNQKLAGLRRLLLVLSIPLLTIYIFQAMLRFDVPDIAPQSSYSAAIEPDEMTWCFLLTGGVSVLVFLPMFSWLSFWIGLKVRSQGKAIIASVSVIVAWCILPVIAMVPLRVFFGMANTELWNLLLMASPMTVIHFNQYSMFEAPYETLWRITVGYGCILLTVRLWCMWRAPRVLGRADTRKRDVVVPAPATE